MKKTLLTDLGGIATAMATAKTFARDHRPWVGVGEQQTDFLSWLSEHERALNVLSTFFKSFASFKAVDINHKLAEAGSEIRLRPWDEDGITFGVASILDLLVEWLVPGETHDGQRPITVRMSDSGNEMSAFRVTSEKQLVRAIQSATDDPILALPLKGRREQILLWRSDYQPADYLDLYRAASALIERMRLGTSTGYQLASVDIPNISADQQPDISWLLGVQTATEETSGYIKISQALQQVRFKMDNVGARIQSETAMAMTRSFGGPRRLRIDGPFMAVCVAEDSDVPLFAGYIAEDSMIAA